MHDTHISAVYQKGTAHNEGRRQGEGANYRLGTNLSTVREQHPSQPHCSSLPFVILACAKEVSRF